MLARHLHDRQEAAERRIGIERQRDAGEIDELGVEHALGDAAPFRMLEQFARGLAVAPVMEGTLAGRVGVDDVDARQAAGNAQYQVALHALRRRQRTDAVREWVLAQRGGERGRNAGARQIDRGVEGVAAAPDREAAVTPARHLDQDFANGENAGLLAAHGTLYAARNRNLDGRGGVRSIACTPWQMRE